MSKTIKIILVAIVIALIVVAVVFTIKSSSKENIIKNETINNAADYSLPNGSIIAKFPEVTDAEGLKTIINKVYSSVEEELLPKLETSVIETSEKDMVKMLTGLNNGDDLEYLVVSQPLMSAQAYSFVLAKVKSGVDANEIAKKMSEQVDTRRWICVEAEKLYATNSGDIVCLVMSDEEKANAVFDSFKKRADNLGEIYEKTAEQEELPPDMY